MPNLRHVRRRKLSLSTLMGWRLAALGCKPTWHRVMICVELTKQPVTLSKVKLKADYDRILVPHPTFGTSLWHSCDPASHDCF